MQYMARIKRLENAQKNRGAEYPIVITGMRKGGLFDVLDGADRYTLNAQQLHEWGNTLLFLHESSYEAYAKARKKGEKGHDTEVIKESMIIIDDSPDDVEGCIPIGDALDILIGKVEFAAKQNAPAEPEKLTE